MSISTDETTQVPIAPESVDVSRPPAPSALSGDNLAAALSAAQGEIVNPAKSSENPHFRSRYANLTEGLEAIKKPLASRGIVYTQITVVKGEILFLVTKLIHVSGQYLESEYPVANWTRTTPQQMGSALTYARRYALFALVGIAGADDDDDGEDASKRQTGADDDPLIGADDVAYIERLLKETNLQLSVFLDRFKVGGIAHLKVSEYKRALELFAQRKKTIEAARDERR
jgi:hypothetical protein